MSKFTPPEYHSTGFQCPYCDFYADQEWQTACCDDDDVYPIRVKKIQVEVSLCSHCENATLWLAEKIIYPPTRMSPPPNSDLPDSVQEVYTTFGAILETELCNR